MAEICYPSKTDWSCVYTEDEILALRSDPDSATVIERSEALAWYTLARLALWQIGVCPTTVRPCAAGCAPSSVTWIEATVGSGNTGGLPLRTIGGSFTPHLTGGNWVNSCGCSRGSCGCSRLSEVILPGPVGGIEEVKLDGVALSPSKYRVDNGNRLVSLDPDIVWPACQDFALDDDQEGTFSVTYYQGAAPNELTRYAAGILANEFYLACAKGPKSGKCRLPSGVKTVVRRGVTYEMGADMFADGRTGIPEVDAVIDLYNPNRLKVRPGVTSPDARRRRPRRTTWMVG